MKLATATYRPGSGWSAALPTELDSEDTLVLAFAAAEYRDRPAPWADLARAFPRGRRLGCSTAGECLADRVGDDSIVLVVARFEHTRLRLARTPIAAPEAPDDSTEAGHRLATQLCDPLARLAGVLVLCDGLHGNGSRLVQALCANLPTGVPVFGGLAGDGGRFHSTWVLVDDHPRSGQAVAIGMYGDDLLVGLDSESGWTEFGPERRITRAEGNRLYELDGRPALTLYKAYLGKFAAGLPASAMLFPISIRHPLRPERPQLRTVLGIDPTDGSMRFAAEIPTGYVARLARSSDEHLLAGTAIAVSEALCQRDDLDRPGLVLSIACFGRRMALGERAEEEAETIVEALTADDVHIGFYGYGEIAVRAPGTGIEVQNQTMSIAFLQER